MKTERLEMRVPPAWLSAVDDWRRRQPVIPSRNEAVRRLVEHALAVDAQGDGTREGEEAGHPRPAEASA